MTFWTEASLEPKRNFRFKINNPTATWWFAKSIDKPSFEVSNSEYQLINHKFKYPGIVTWKNIQVTLMDFAKGGPNGGAQLEKELSTMGYTRPDKTPMKGISKSDGEGSTSAVYDLQIQHLAADGTTIVDAWILKGAFIISATYNKLEYSSDDLSEITLEIAYDYADYGEGGQARLDRLTSIHPQPKPGEVIDL
tara:strand:+ start:115 stop:696 length:582 start_codon:yes stop_codon:yes gene_type:complete